MLKFPVAFLILLVCEFRLAVMSSSSRQDHHSIAKRQLINGFPNVPLNLTCTSDTCKNGGLCFGYSADMSFCICLGRFSGIEEYLSLINLLLGSLGSQILILLIHLILKKCFFIFNYFQNNLRTFKKTFVFVN